MSSSSGRGPQGDINVTPLVDVVRVLLIIFMVVTPMLQEGVDVMLPAGPHAVKKPGEEGDLVISIKEDGSIFVLDSWISEQDLSGWLGEERSRNGDREILLKADARVDFGRVRQVMKSLEEAEFTRVAILTEQKAGTEAGAI